jgi:hypothetical protein
MVVPSAPPTMKRARMPVIRVSVQPPNDTLPTEEDFGIIEFLDKSDRKPFQACFKQRYGKSLYLLMRGRFTDFMVREVTQDGTILKITDTTTLPEYDIKELEEKNKVYNEEEGVQVFTALLGILVELIFTYNQVLKHPKSWQSLQS